MRQTDTRPQHANSEDQSEHALRPPLKPLLTPKEFWNGTGRAIGQHSIYELIQARRIKHIRVGRKILIPRSELEEFLLREAA